MWEVVRTIQAGTTMVLIEHTSSAEATAEYRVSAYSHRTNIRPRAFVRTWSEAKAEAAAQIEEIKQLLALFPEDTTS